MPTSPAPATSGGNFRRFWAGQTLAQFGTQVGAVALPVLAVQLLHASEADLGYLNAASTAAFLLVGLPAGAWVDRWFKRPTMIAADAVRVVAAVVPAILWFAGVLQMWHLVACALVLGLASVFFEVAYQSFIPVLVPDEEIGRANSHLETTFQLARLGGPALGGLLLRVISAPVLLLADALGYLASVVFLLGVRDDERTERDTADPIERRPLHREIAEGLSFVWNQPAIRRITTSTLISNLTATMAFTLAPILYLRIIGFDAFTYGLTLTAGALGGVLGAMVVPRLARRFSDHLLLPGGMLVAAAGLLVQPMALFVHPRPLAATVVCVGQFVMVVGVLVYNITQVTMRQRLCPKRLLGRMNASIRFVIWGVMPIASLLGGWLGGIFGPWAVMVAGALLGFLAVIPLLGIRPHLPARDLA